MKRNVENKNSFSMFICLVIIVLLFCAQNVVLLNLNSKDGLTESVENYLNQTLVIDCQDEFGNHGFGSGIIVSKNRIITAAHLVTEVSSIDCKLYNGKTFSAELEQINEDLDLAVLSYSENVPFNKVSFAKQKEINFNQPIVKIGNALNYGLSVDVGVVSSPYVRLEVGEVQKELIQISIDICGGDSGGVVFNENGQVIGIISFKTSSSISSDRELSFIVPSYIVKDFYLSA